MEEDWDSEANSQPEPPFTLAKTTPHQQHGQKQFFLKYVKTIHGRETAARVRAELNALKITVTKLSAMEAGVFSEGHGQN